MELSAEACKKKKKTVEPLEVTNRARPLRACWAQRLSRRGAHTISPTPSREPENTSHHPACYYPPAQPVRYIKERGLIREGSSNCTSTFYSCIVFHMSRSLPEGALSCRWPAAECSVYYRTGGVTGGNSIIYGFYSLGARLVYCAHKNRQLRDLTVLIKSLVTCNRSPRHPSPGHVSGGGR